MEIMYWITRLEYINIFLGVCVFFSAGAFLLTLVIKLFGDIDNDYEDAEHKLNKNLRNFGISFLIFGIAFIFVPSKKDIYEIYGVGGTMEYLHSNEKAKELPDKVIKVIDAWADNIVREQNENTENK